MGRLQRVKDFVWAFDAGEMTRHFDAEYQGNKEDRDQQKALEGTQLQPS